MLEGIAGSQWGVTVGGAGGVLIGEESGEGVEWRGSGGCGLPPSVAREEAWRWEPPTESPTDTGLLPPTEDRRNSLLPPSKNQTSTSIKFLIFILRRKIVTYAFKPP